MKNTIRILVDWKCNLNCSYCCNTQKRFRDEIVPTKLEDINFNSYENVCITGGEPLLNMPKVKEVCDLIPDGKVTILYSNGLLMTEEIAKELEKNGVDYVNIGLHATSSFRGIIQKVVDSVKNTNLKVRFHANEKESWVLEEFPGETFRFWKMDDCERDNEDRVILS